MLIDPLASHRHLAAYQLPVTPSRSFAARPMSMPSLRLASSLSIGDLVYVMCEDVRPDMVTFFLQPQDSANEPVQCASKVVVGRRRRIVAIDIQCKEQERLRRKLWHDCKCEGWNSTCKKHVPVIKKLVLFTASAAIAIKLNNILRNTSNPQELVTMTIRTAASLTLPLSWHEQLQHVNTTAFGADGYLQGAR